LIQELASFYLFVIASVSFLTAVTKKAALLGRLEATWHAVAEHKTQKKGISAKNMGCWITSVTWTCARTH